MPISADDRAFLIGPFQRVEGWCVDEAAYLTTHLLREQQALGLFAPSFEIGVYKGKYLSVLHNCARQSGTEVVGFDIFEWASISMVEEHLRQTIGDLTGIRLVKGDSTGISPEVLMEHLGYKKAGFASIDGSHTPDAVCGDLMLAEAVLDPRGIVAIDDFLNPMAIGATEGAMRFWQTQETDLVPFAYCRNKLFAAHLGAAEQYSAATLEFSEEHAELPACRAMLDNKAKGLHWAKQEFLGQHVWILPP